MFNLRIVALASAESLKKDQQSYENNGSSASTIIELVPEVENPNDINSGSIDESVNMYDFASCFDDLSSDASNISSAKCRKTNLKKKCSERIINNTGSESELDKFCYLPFELRDVDPFKW